MTPTKPEPVKLSCCGWQGVASELTQKPYTFPNGARAHTLHCPKCGTDLRHDHITWLNG